METNRQKKIAGVLQKDLVGILQNAAKGGAKGTIISVTKVHVTTDLSLAKVYISIFPNNKIDELLKGIVSNTSLIKHKLSQLTRHQLRKMPDLTFYIDDSLDYIEGIDSALRGDDEDPIKHPEILPKRKKN